MKTEEAIEFLGFGRFQHILIAIGCITFMYSAVIVGSVFFFTYSPNYRCAIADFENDTFSPFENRHRDLINQSLPDGEDRLCNVYDVDQPLSLTFNNGSTNNSVVNDEPILSRGLKKCDKWVYDKSLFVNTLVIEYNLVCDDGLKIAHTRMLVFGGFLCGSLICGVLGDLLGRKTTHYIALTTALVCSISVPWISNPETYMLLVFGAGLGGFGAYINMFVILMEFVDKRKRVLVVTLSTFGWVCGLIYVPSIAYFIRDWRMLQIAVAYPFGLLLLGFWFVPESIRWLVSRGNHKKADQILRKIARRNGVAMQSMRLCSEEANKIEGWMNVMIQVFSTPTLFKRFLILLVNWFTVALVYYGLTLNSGNITGDVFLEFILSSAIEIPAYFVVLVALDRMGRKLMHISAMVIGGLSCIGTIFPVIFTQTDLKTLTVVLVTIGKATATATFHILFIYTPEVFPTSMRMSIIGIMSSLCRVGSMTAPYVADLGKLIGGVYSTVLPLLVFGGLTLIAGFLCIPLPETKGVKLPGTIEEAKQLKSKTLNSSVQMKLLLTQKQ